MPMIHNGPCSDDCPALDARDVEFRGGDPGASIEGVERISPLVADDHATLVAYLLLCVRNRDWHGVSDAANDLRVLEARSGR